MVSPFLVKDRIVGCEGTAEKIDKSLVDGLCAWDIKEFKLAARGIDTARFLDCQDPAKRKRRKRILSTFHRELRLGVTGQFRRDRLGNKSEITRNACIDPVYWQTLRRDKHHKLVSKKRRKRREDSEKDHAEKKDLYPSFQPMRGCSPSEFADRESVAKS